MAQLIFKNTYNNPMLVIVPNADEIALETKPECCRHLYITQYRADSETILTDICNVVGTTLPEVETNYDGLVIATDFNPWVLCLNWKTVLYFGEDKPVVKSKTVKTVTAKYRLWKERNYFTKPSGEPDTYYYAQVKEPDKLIILDDCYRMRQWHPDAIIAPDQYLTKFDYPESVIEERRAAKKEKERQLAERAKQYQEELEIKKRTPGFCSRCGRPNADLVNDPVEEELRGNKVKLWLCRPCYEDMCLEI